MMTNMLIESIDPFTLDNYVKDTYKTIDDFLSSGKSFGDVREGSFGMISKNPIAKAVLGNVLNKVAELNGESGLSRYKSILRYTTEPNKCRRYIYLISTVIPAFAKYLLDDAKSYSGNQDFEADAVRNAVSVFDGNYRRACKPSNNAMAVVAEKFGIALKDAGEIGTGSRPNTSVEDDTSASAALNEKYSNIVPMMKSAADFIYSVLMETVGTDATNEGQVNLASNLLLAYYWNEDSDIKASGINTMGEYLDYRLEKSDPEHKKTLNNAKIDYTEDDVNDAESQKLGLVPKNVDVSEDPTNQHTVISGTTRFLARSYTPLFTANFSSLIAKQPKSFNSKNPQATQPDIMLAIKLMYKKIMPGIDTTKLTPEMIDEATKAFVDDTDTALAYHQGMADYIINELYDDWIAKHPDANGSYIKKLQETIASIYLLMRNNPPDYLMEPSYCFADYSSNDRIKETNETSTGMAVAPLFINDGENLHIMNMNTRKKTRRKSNETIEAHEIDTIPLDEVRKNSNTYRSSALVNIGSTWGVLDGIIPASEILGEDFADSMTRSPFTSDAYARLGDQQPSILDADKTGDINRIMSRLHTPDNLKKLGRVGFINGNESTEQLQDLAKKVASKVDGLHDAITRTNDIAKAYTGVANAYIKKCQALKDFNLQSTKILKLYNASATAVTFVTDGEHAVTYSAYSFLRNEISELRNYLSPADKQALANEKNAYTTLFSLTKAVKLLRSNIGSNNDALIVSIVNKCTELMKRFLSWAKQNVDTYNLQLSDADSAIASTPTEQISSIVPTLVDENNIARWSENLDHIAEKGLKITTGDDIVDEEIKNIQYLIDGWNAVVRDKIVGKGYTTNELKKVTNLCASLSQKGLQFQKFNQLYTAGQMLVTLGGIDDAAQLSNEPNELPTFEYDNIPDSETDLAQAAPVSFKDSENANAGELYRIDKVLDDPSVMRIYGGDVGEAEIAEDPINTFKGIINDINSETSSVDKALDMFDSITKMTDTSKKLSMKLDVLTSQFQDESEYNEMQQNAVWDFEKRINTINELISRAKELLVNMLEHNEELKPMIDTIRQGEITTNEVKSARRYVEVADVIENDRYVPEYGQENSYTNDDTSTIAHVLSMVGEEVFSPDGADLIDLNDNLTTLRSYVGNASGNPASMKVIDHVLKTLQNNFTTQVKVYSTLIKLINQLGPFISSGKDSVTNLLNNTTGLRYAKTNVYAKDDALDNPIDAFARAQLRPMNAKTSGVLSNKESAERMAYIDMVRNGMRDNPELAKYAYTLGKALQTFERSIVDDDERYSDAERAARMFNSIQSSLTKGNSLVREIAPSTAQRVIYNAIFDDERSGSKNYPKTSYAVSALINGSNLQLLTKEFGNSDKRDFGPQWASSRNKTTFKYSNANNSLVGSRENAVPLDQSEDRESIIASWFNPDDPIDFTFKENEYTGEVTIPTGELVKLVKSARKYIGSKIAGNLGKIDDMTGDVVLANGKTSEYLKAAVKSIYALVDDIETPIADVIVATTSLGQKSGRDALVKRAKDSLIKNDPNYTVDDMSVVASETNVFPERISGELSNVDQDWVDKMVTLVSMIPTDMTEREVMLATKLYCGSKYDQQKMMANPNLKTMYVILKTFQSVNRKLGAPIGYFGDNSADERKSLEALITNVCAFKEQDDSWKDAAENMGRSMAKSIENGDVIRRVGDDLPSMPARRRVAHLRRDPYYSVKHNNTVNQLAGSINRALFSDKYVIPNKSGHSIMFSDYDFSLDTRTYVYWLYIVANNMAESDSFTDVEDAEYCMDNVIMTYVTGVKPKYLKHMVDAANDSKMTANMALSSDFHALTGSYAVNENMVNVHGVGLLTTEAYVAAVRTAYAKAVEETNGHPLDNDIARAFYVQLGVLTGKTYNADKNLYDDEKPVYDVDDLNTVRPKVEKQPTVIKQPTKQPIQKPTQKPTVPTPQPVEDEEEEEFHPEVHVGND